MVAPATATAPVPYRRIGGVRVNATSYKELTGLVIRWANAGVSRYICLGTVNSVMEAQESERYHAALEQAELVTADGMPLVWMLQALGIADATRVYGPDLTLKVVEAAAGWKIPVGFYGGDEDALDALVEVCQRNHPALRVAFAEAPPYRPPTPEEDLATVDAIRESGVKILLVGLGGTKQDLWMQRHVGQFPAVMLGVGAAFDFISGAKRQAPRWMMRWGLEWLFRLASEPRRLAGRYLKHNPRFILLALRQLISHWGDDLSQRFHPQ